MPEIVTQRDITLHTDEVQDILGQVPSRVMRYGMFAFALIFSLFISLLFLIKYPDIIPSQLTIYANNSPKAVVSHTSGKLITLFVREKMTVQQGSILAIIESNAKYEQVIELEKVLTQAQQNIAKNELENIRILSTDFSQLGEIQPSFQLLTASFFQIQTLLNQKLYSKKQSLVSSDITNSESVKSNLLGQKEILQKDYQLELDDYTAQKKLYDQKVISKSELRKEESKLLAKKSALENIDVSLVNNSTVLSSYRKESLELEKQLLDAKYAFSENLSKLSNEIATWKKKYLLIAPTTGNVTFNQNVQELQDVAAEQTIFFITPPNEGTYGEMYISQSNFGKIETGQKVVIHLESYPYQEYGSLIGHVTFISNIPATNKTYLVRVKLSPELVTDTGLKIPFKNGLSANGQIITKQIRIINRFYYSLNSLFEKKAPTTSATK